MLLDPLERDQQLASEFHQLEDALASSKFSKHGYTSEFIAYWVTMQYESIAERHEHAILQLQDKEDEHGLVLDRIEGNLWKRHLNHCFLLCNSAAAKRAVWGGIAHAMIREENTPVLQQSTAFLQEHVKWAPKSVHKTSMRIFAGSFASGLYTPQSLIAAAHWMKNGHGDGAKHIRDWLLDISLAPGVLPVRKAMNESASKAMDDSKDQRRYARNTILWSEVVAPYCLQHPQDALVSERVFFHLPMVSTPKTLPYTQALADSLPSEHQKQWLYANLIGNGKQSNDVFNDFWKESLVAQVSPRMLDLRLYLAAWFLPASHAQTLAQQTDPATMSMLEGLGSNTVTELREVLYERWMNRAPDVVPLPQNWYDENTALGL